ncbi:MAG TPA: ATP-binding protein [Gaiellaceae bacterium]|nr:ATP-binding protein [Gaiellaceae bacterium]
MDAAVVERHASAEARAQELRSRAADARSSAAAERRRSELALDRAVTLLIGFGGRPFGDRDGRFLLRLGRVRPVVRFVRHDLRRWLEAAGLPPEPVSEVTLACSEGCANAVEHAHRAARQLVEVEATLGGGELELRIRDFGTWNRQQRSTLRGRGLEMMRQLMDSLDVQRTPHGTELVMRKTFARTTR